MFAEDGYANVRKPLNQAETLPGWCYTSGDFFAREVETIFAPRWQFIGRADELPDAGSFVTRDGICGPVLVVRGADRQLRAFANACRHRGTKLLSGNGQCRHIVCPYHSWVYRLDGALERAPGMAEVTDFSAGDYGLVPLRLEEWDGFVFVNAHHNATPLLSHLGNMPETFANHRLGEMRCVRRVEFEVTCNWKLLIENALEAYHTGTVHRDTLGTQVAYPRSSTGNWDTVYIPWDGSIAVLPEATAPFAQIAGLNGDAVNGTYFTAIYPCTQFAIAQDCMWWLDIEPIAVNRCHLTLGSCFPESTVNQDGFERDVAPYYARWDSATPEDNAIAELQQIGLSAGQRGPGRFATSEFAVHKLANWVLDQVLDD